MGEDRAMSMSDEEKKMKKRLYNREKQRAHRQKVNEQVEVVEAEIGRLEAILAQLQTNETSNRAICQDGTLSWNIISSVFRRESSMSRAERTSLRKEVSNYDTLIRNMQKFVVANVPRPIPHTTMLWQRAFLMAHPDARRMGKEWLTQQLYYNMDACLRYFPPHGGNDEFFHVDVDVSGDCIHVMEVVQHVWPTTFEVFKSFLQTRMPHVIFKDPTKVKMESTGNTRLFQLTTEKGSFVNFLQGFFVEADRFIVVMRQVEDDETFSSRPYRQHHHVSWLEVRRLSATSIVTRLLSHVTQHFRDTDGLVSVDEQADIWEIDLGGVPEDQKRDKLREEYMRSAYKHETIFRQRILDNLNIAMLEGPC